MHTQERALLRKSMDISSRVERLLKKKYGCKWFKLKQEDEIRLIRLAQWEEKYHVSLDWILSQLLPVWQKQMAKQAFAFRAKGGLGISVATLTGEKSEEILKQATMREFPKKENVQHWQVREQERQWAQFWERGKGREDWDHPTELLSAYRKRVGKEREERKKFASRAKQRNYRGNPWW